MIKKVQDKKKKTTSTANLFFKVNDKNDKINLKFALNMYVPKTTNLLVSPKHNEPQPHKHLKMAVATPKNKPTKKSVKENGYHTVFHSNTNSATSTPFDYEHIEIK